MSSSVAIVNWNSRDRLRACVESLLANVPGSEIVVIDNASTDGSVESLSDLHDHIDLIRSSVNRGFASAVNAAVADTTSPYVLILNPDIRVTPNAVQLLEQVLDAHPKAGAVGGYVNDKYLPRPLPTTASLIRENLGFKRTTTIRKDAGPTPVDQPAAAALMVRREAFDAIGGFDDRFYPAWYEDVDFCWRLKTAGWEIWFEPEAEFKHEGGYSAAAMGSRAFAEAYYRNQLRFTQKHFGLMAQLMIRTSMAVGMLLRMVAKPSQFSACRCVLIGALIRW
jgi:GT2 family glycosyltransferase